MTRTRSEEVIEGGRAARFETAARGAEESYAIAQVREFIEGHAIVGLGDPVPRGGRPLPGEWLLDIRTVFLDPACLAGIACVFWEQFGDFKACQVVAPELGAVPLLGAILVEARKRGIDANGLIVRKSRGKNGLRKSVEGVVRSVPTIVVDDLVQSGESLERVRLALEGFGLRFHSVFVVVDFRAPRGIAWRKTHHVNVKSLFSLDDLRLERKRPEPSVEGPVDEFETVWTYSDVPPSDLGDVVAKSSPLAADGRIFFGASDGTFRSIDAMTGKLNWSFRIGYHRGKGIRSSPAHYDGVVYFGGYDGDLYALDAVDGRPLWRAPCCEYVGSSPTLAPKLGLMFIGLEREVPGRRGALAAFELSTGRTIWEVDTARYLHGTPAYESGAELVVCGTNDAELLTVGARDGVVRWRTKLGGDVKMAPTIDPVSGSVYVGAMDGGLYSFDLLTGERRFVHMAESAIYATPLLAAGRLFVPATDKRLHVLDARDGRPIAKLHSRARSFSSPALIDGGVVFGNNAGLLFDIDPRTLVLRARYQISDRIVSKVAHDPATGLYFVHTFEDRLIALRKVSAQGGAE